MKSKEFLEKLTEYTNFPSDCTLSDIEEETGEGIDFIMIPGSDLKYICNFAIKVDDGILILPCTSVDSLVEYDKEIEIESINFNLDLAYLLEPKDYDKFTKDQTKNLDSYKSSIFEFTKPKFSYSQKLEWVKNYLWNTCISWEDATDPGDVTDEMKNEWEFAKILTDKINYGSSFDEITSLLNEEIQLPLCVDCLNLINQMYDEDFAEKHEEEIKPNEDAGTVI